MRVRFSLEGGIAHFPGLARPVEIDLESLPAAERAELAALLERAAQTAAPPTGRAATRARGADRRRYAIEIETAAGWTSLAAEEPLTDPELQRLVRTLEALARRLRRGA